tara:strand:- start:7342 stop:8064 length:723 start_codon:yes stop_codon:yes gene_type:complete
MIGDIFSLEGKVAIVTGASAGNGAAVANGLKEYGAVVFNLDIKPGDNKENFIECDITNKEDLKQIIEYIVDKCGTIDILVNNAGVTYGGYSDEAWEKTYNVNLKAPYILSKLVAEEMKKNSNGSIINITSLNSELAFPDNPAYVTMKGGLKQLTKALALDLGKHNIRVNNIGPGYMRTNMTKKSWSNPETREERENKTVLQRWGEPCDLVGTAVYLASNASSYVTGQDIYVDGGWLIKGL